MSSFLLAAATGVLVAVAAGLVRVVRGPSRTDRVMAVQLLGAGALASILLYGAATELPAAFDVALLLALLAPFATIASARAAATDAPRSADRADA
jgi:multicomponent Na+:H+ antiporter subunit F